MSDIVWGPELAVCDQMPDWMLGGDMIQRRYEGGISFAEPEKAAESQWEGMVAIRLPADHRYYATLATPTPPNTPAGYSDEVVELRAAIMRALQCTPRVVVNPGERGEPMFDIEYDCGDPWEILREALLPEPVDADLVEAREIAKPWLIYDSPEGIAAGDYDKQPALVAILAAIKRGRALAEATHRSKGE